MHPEARDRLKLKLEAFDVAISFKPTDFTQVNHRVNREMVGRAIELLDVKPEHHVADFFCGLGNFTLPLARRSEYVTGIEGSEALVERARAGAAANGLAQKTTFVARNLFTWSTDDWDALWEKWAVLIACLLILRVKVLRRLLRRLRPRKTSFSCGVRLL